MLEDDPTNERKNISIELTVVTNNCNIETMRTIHYCVLIPKDLRSYPTETSVPVSSLKLSIIEASQYRDMLSTGNAR